MQKGQPFDLYAIIELKTAILDSGWPFSICTGRGVPYIEGIVQMLGLTDSSTALVCEGGAVSYVPRTDRHEILGAAVSPQRVRALLPPGSYREELGKVACCSVYPEPGYTVQDLYELITQAELAGATVIRSVAAVDVTAAGVDKAYGISRLLDREGATWTDVLAIGDSWNDLPMLTAAGVWAYTANAVDEVKQAVDYISPLRSSRGVADILRWAQNL